MQVDKTSALWFEVIERPITSWHVPRYLRRCAQCVAPAHAVAVPAASTEAYELTLLGRHADDRLYAETIRKARDYFQRAIDGDSTMRGVRVLALSWIFDRCSNTKLPARRGSARTPLLDKALVLGPDLPEAHAANGFAATQMWQYDLARKHLARALELAPGSGQTWLWIGSVAKDDGKVVEALEHYARATELDPLGFNLQGLRGLAAIMAGRFDEAQVHYARAVKLAPNHPNPRWGAGILGYARGRLDDAVKGYRHALAADSRRRDLWFELGRMYLDLGLAGEADEAFAQGKALLRIAAHGSLVAARVLFIAGRSAQIPDFFARTGCC